MKQTMNWKGLVAGGMTALLGATGAMAHKIEEATPAGPADQPAEGQAKVQLAILLDTSGSMSGLIEQTKTQLWRIVNTFIDAKQNGQVPYVEVALYEYGNDGLNAEAHWLRRIQPLTRDLDQVSADLFSLRTNGGSEYCGAVIERATLDLSWDSSPDVYKAIFVAGNEPFTQGPIEAAKSCQAAIAKGIIVNTIHCGTEQAGMDGGWKSGAMLADGKFLVIDHNQAVVHIEAPQDAEILRLNTELNKTYIPIGVSGQERWVTQTEQDKNAEANAQTGAAVQRAACKASHNYVNSNWDLVDACKTKGFKWEELKVTDLPEEMKKLDEAGRKAYVAKKEKERQAIQSQMQKLNEERDAYVNQKRKELGEEVEDTLDQVVVNTVREQALKKGYSFEEK
jgi:hypothetical protein